MFTSMQVMLVAAMSVDGKIAESADQRSLDWTSKEDLKFFIEKTKECGVVVMGRKTFDTIGKPLKGRRVIVMTRSPHESDMEGVEFTSEDPKTLVDRLQTEGHDKIAVAGGSMIYSLFLREGLVTDLYLTIEPVLFGSGVPLASDLDRIDLKLVETSLLGEQSVLLHFSA